MLAGGLKELECRVRVDCVSGERVLDGAFDAGKRDLVEAHVLDDLACGHVAQFGVRTDDEPVGQNRFGERFYNVRDHVLPAFNGCLCPAGVEERHWSPAARRRGRGPGSHESSIDDVLSTLNLARAETESAVSLSPCRVEYRRINQRNRYTYRESGSLVCSRLREVRG